MRKDLTFAWGTYTIETEVSYTNFEKAERKYEYRI